MSEWVGVCSCVGACLRACVCVGGERRWGGGRPEAISVAHLSLHVPQAALHKPRGRRTGGAAWSWTVKQLKRKVFNWTPSGDASRVLSIETEKKKKKKKKKKEGEEERRKRKRKKKKKKTHLTHF